jgi:hypothetical protein
MRLIIPLWRGFRGRFMEICFVYQTNERLLISKKKTGIELY